VALALALTILAPPLARGAAPPAGPRPENVVIMIPDGCGPATLVLARLARGRPLSLDSILVGAVETGSSSSRITDSAAGATAYASGVKTANRVVGMDPAGNPVETLMEAAASRGMATGFIVKSRVTDATPAAFVAHVRRRSQEDEIAVQELAHRVNLIMGGGLDRFLPEPAGGRRADGRDLVAEARGRGDQVVLDRAEFDGDLRLPLLALFAPAELPYEIDRDPKQAPGLVEMVRRGLPLLAREPGGFLLVIEGSRIDHAAHANDPASHVREALEFDDTVREVLAFARRDGRTLVVGAADHETGGLSLGRRVGDTPLEGVYPESLMAVRCSAERMADSIRAGHPARELVERETGLHLTLEEAGMLDRALRGRRLAETIGEIESRHAALGWSTWGHTAIDVGLYAFGPGSDRFRGVLDNTEVGRRIAESLDVQVGGSRSPRAPGRGGPATP